MRVVSLLNSGAYINTEDKRRVCYCQGDKHVGCSVQGTYRYYTCGSMYTCICRAYVNCGHVVYRAQDVVQCASIVGAVASAAVSSDGSYSH